MAENLYQDIKKYVKYKDVYICPNGIPVNPNLPTTIKKEFNILFLSNMMKEKGVWDLVESCRILKINGRSVKCHFVGKWSDITKEKFAAEINKRGLKEYVSAYGAKYNDEKDTFLQKADVFVFPTYYNNECFPLVLLEAMEQGIPCISTNEGGIPAIIEDGKTNESSWTMYSYGEGWKREISERIYARQVWEPNERNINGLCNFNIISIYEKNQEVLTQTANKQWTTKKLHRNSIAYTQSFHNAIWCESRVDIRDNILNDANKKVRQDNR